jgi:glycosyltransferase involved in cell wall biosynthesis
MNPAAVGGDLYLWELAKGLSKNGNHVSLLCGSFPGSKARENISGVKIIRLPGSWNLPFKILKKYFEELKGNFDVVIEEAIGGQRFPFFCSLYIKEPLVAVWHQKHSKIFREQYSFVLGNMFSFLEFFQAKIYRKRPILTPSKGAKNQIVSLGFNANNINVVYDGVAKEFLDAKLDKNRENLIVYLGKLRRYKRPDHAILGFAGLLKVFKKPCRLVIAGKTSEIDKCYVDELRQLAQKLGVSNLVNFEINISEEEKLNLLKKARILVQPSPVEGFSIVVIEANACGTPVVASDGVPPDVVINGRNGVVYPYGDITAQSMAIFDLLSDAGRWQRMSEKGVLWAQNFTWEKSAASLTLFLRKIVSIEAW